MLRYFSSQFSDDAQHRGRDLFRRRAVKIIQAGPGEIVARVDESPGNDIFIEYDPADPAGTASYECTCEYFRESSGEPCKHLWAALLQADGEGVLPQGDPRPSESMRSLKADENHDDGDGSSRLQGGEAAGSDVSEDADEAEDDDDHDAAQVRVMKHRAAATLQEFNERMKQSRDTPGTARSGSNDKSNAWKRQLEQLKEKMRYSEASTTFAPTAPPWPGSKRIMYVIDATGTHSTPGLAVELYSQSVRRDGGLDRPKQLKIERGQVATLPDPEDRRILQLLLGAAKSDWGYSYYENQTARRFTIAGGAFQSTLEPMCRTGRCFIRRHNNEHAFDPVSWDDGATWNFWLEVKNSPGGRFFVLDGSLRRGDVRVSVAEPDLILREGLVLMKGAVSRLDHMGAFDLLMSLRQGLKMSVPIDQRDELLRILLGLPRLPKLELPDDLKFEELRPTPRPRLVVRKPKNERYEERLLGTPTFEYAGQMIDASHEGQAILTGEGRAVIYRNFDAEAQALARLIQVGFRESVEYLGSRPVKAYRLAVTKLAKAVADLTTEGWIVEAEGKLYRQAGEVKVQVKSGIDWFELHGDVSFGDGLSASMPRLLEALRRGDKTVQLDDGSLGMLPEDWLKRYAALAGLGETEEDHLKFSKRQVGFLDALLTAVPEATFDETFARARGELQRFGGIAPLAPPESFSGELRAYQREGLGWMHFLRTFGFGGCLADDMGLGKTVQVLALLEDRRHRRGAAPAASSNGNGDHAADSDRKVTAPSLVVVPRSLVFNWVEEAKRFTPNLRVLDHTHAQRKKGADHFEAYDIILTTYGTLRRDAAYFKDLTFDYVILDEAQAVKNAQSESAKAVRLLQADHRLALSGTPVQNHLGELWSLFDFLNPGMMGVASVFKSIGAGAATVAPEVRQLLSKALRPFILRRTKEQVAKDLPAKTEQTLICELDAEQRKQYDELRAHYRASLLDRIAREGMNKAKIEILEALLRLRQAACHPGLIDKRRVKEGSAKLNTLLAQVNQVLDEGHKVLVFSQFTSFLAIARDRFDEAKVPYEYLDGKTRDRQARVERFQNDPDCKLFLISLKAGGLGLNLTAAEYVFLLDPWWNPAVEAQAIDRAHRIGQTRQVFAYRLIAKDTVEEKVLQLQQNKKDLADAIINADNSLVRNLGREDLELLLS